MSIRAYRVIKKEVASQNTFNIWHDDEIIDFLNKKEDKEVTANLGENGGEFEVSVDTLEELLESGIVKEEYQIKAIKADIAFAKKHKDAYILYDCC